MRIPTALLLSGVLVGATAAQDGAPAVADSGETQMRAKIHRKPKWILPAENPTEVATGFRFSAGIGAEFKADIDGEALLIDADADGELETRVEGEGGFVVLTSGDQRYGAVISAKPAWSFRAGSAMVGVIGKTKVQLIDQNHNGRFDDVGEDALVDRPRARCLLSVRGRSRSTAELLEIRGRARRIDLEAGNATTGDVRHARPSTRRPTARSSPRCSTAKTVATRST